MERAETSSDELPNYLQEFGRDVEGLDEPPTGAHLSLTFEELRDLCTAKSVYAFRENFVSGVTQYGKITVHGNYIYVHSSDSQKPEEPAVQISFKELLLRYSEDAKHPRSAFLMLDYETSVSEHVVIVTDSLSSRALNFLLICSGIKGSSYKGKTLKYWGNTVGTVPSEEEKAVIGGLTDGDIYEAPVRKGMVCGCWSKYPDNLSRFNIWMEKPLVKVTTKFGYVEEGLEVLERMFKVNQSYQIKDCGLAIQCAKIEDNFAGVAPDGNSNEPNVTDSALRASTRD